MNIVYFYFFILIPITFAEECCEVRPWSSWGECSKTCGSSIQERTRICSTYDGWTLGLTCNKADAVKVNAKKYQKKTCYKDPCRKLLILIEIYLDICREV